MGVLVFGGGSVLVNQMYSKPHYEENNEVAAD